MGKNLGREDRIVRAFLSPNEKLSSLDGIILEGDILAKVIPHGFAAYRTVGYTVRERDLVITYDKDLKETGVEGGLVKEIEMEPPDKVYFVPRIVSGKIDTNMDFWVHGTDNLVLYLRFLNLNRVSVNNEELFRVNSNSLIDRMRVVLADENREMSRLKKADARWYMEIKKIYGIKK